MTLGDPSGIGPEVVAKSIQHLSNKGDELPFIIGDTNTVNDAFSNLDTDIQVKKIKNVSEIGSESKSIFVLDILPVCRTCIVYVM